VLLLGLLIVVGLGLGLGLGLTGTPSTSSTTTPDATRDLRFGLSVPSLLGERASQQAAALANMKSIGLQWVRVDADWSLLQPNGPRTFDWAPMDQEVRAIEAAGMHADLIIDNTPPWARTSAANVAWGEPATASAYGTFAGQVAAHYGPMGVNTYEIWNEENVRIFWAPAPNPSLYTSMLKDAYAAIKAARPNATVISGGLAPAADDSAGDIAPIKFLQDMYADGAKGSFDALGDHAYSNPALPDTFETWSGFSQMDQTSPSLRSVMAANGDSAKQIWITEIGAPSAGPNGVGTTAQAEEVNQAVAAAKSSSWIGAMFFYTYEDSPNADPDYYGLLNADGSAKPAWTALAAALAS
jgi:polysaccharide biosynthesis protein PslG